MSTNNFKQFNFYDDINPDTLEHIFESAWDTLQKLYPDKKFDSCDCFSIYIIEDFIDEDDDFNDDLVFVTGLMDGKPAIQNLGTKEIILVELNSKRHYKIFCVNGNTGFRNESRIFYFIHLQNEEDYERKESSSA
jgi:hypothetical protein